MKIFQIVAAAFLLLAGFSIGQAQMCGVWSVRVAIVTGKGELIKNAKLALVNVPEEDNAQKIKFSSTNDKTYNLVGKFYEGGNYSLKYEAKISAPGHKEQIVNLSVRYCETSTTKFSLEKDDNSKSRNRSGPGSIQNEQVQKLLTDAYSRGEFSGVVLAARSDKTIFNGTVGKANRSWNVDNRLSTKFRICSVTKQFTALLVMQFVEAGKINLDASVSEYLPEFKKETGSRIKIRDLLTSASGLTNLPDDFYVSEDAKMTDANFVVGKYLQGDLQFEPGAKFNYNNADFIVLGRIIEKVSGKSYEQNLSEKILVPLGMKNTGLLKNESVIENAASGYSFKDGAFLNESFVRIQNFGAAGAMYSTAEDLLLWDKSLLSNKLLSKKITDEMFTPSEKLGFVALGSWKYNLKFGGKEKTIVERQGYINGFCALNIIIPEDDFSLIFLSNVETQTLFQTYASKGLSFEILKNLVK